MIVVADSSPLRYLIVIEQQNLLPTLFGEIWVPTAALNELSVIASPAIVRDFLREPPEWLRVRDPAEKTLAAISAGLDGGERAALLSPGTSGLTWYSWTMQPAGGKHRYKDCE